MYGELGWTATEFWKTSMCDIVIALNAKLGKRSVDLSGLNESADAIKEKLEREGNA